jgi:hypothetical protein
MNMLIRVDRVIMLLRIVLPMVKKTMKIKGTMSHKS